MGIKAALSIPFARLVAHRIKKASSRPKYCQDQVFRNLIAQGKKTTFGNDHQFEKIHSYEDFVGLVPLRDYEQLSDYIHRAVEGKENVLWPGKPLYFCKTSGTTSGAKYIPITKNSMPNHLNSARNALLSYIAETRNASFVQGKMIFLQGSPKLDTLPSGIPCGRLSGIVANHVPSYLQKNRMPSFKTNCIEDWEEKVDAIVKETLPKDMTLISGIPSWVQMYFERLLKKSGKRDVQSIFANFSLFVYGGVNFEPYRQNFQRLVGKDTPSIELYPASEGFIAYQDSQTKEGMLLTINSGIFYEFVKTQDIHQENPKRYRVHEVELGQQYALILSSNAGLWAYNIGDTVKFVSLTPPRIKVTGRIKHFTSAFGEHVIGEEVEFAMQKTAEKFGLRVAEFHVAPQTNPSEGLPYHEWLVEGDDIEFSSEALQFLDDLMQKQNPYYEDLIQGKVLQPLKVTLLKSGSFNAFMKSKGKLGGQNKVARLSDSRLVANALVQLQ